MQIYTLEAGAQMLAVQVEMTTRIVTALKGARAKVKTHKHNQKATLFWNVRNCSFYQARLRTTSRRRNKLCWGFVLIFLL